MNTPCVDVIDSSFQALYIFVTCGTTSCKAEENQDAVRFLVQGAQLNLLAEVDKEPAFFAARRPAGFSVYTQGKHS